MHGMKKINTIFTYLSIFLVLSAVLFGVQWLLMQENVLTLNYKIHFLIFFITFISLITMLVIFGLEKKNTIGFVFLGFVIFKFFAMGYVAYFQPEFKLHIVPYFVIYWAYLVIEVVFVLKLIKKQD